jgi:hypothetical protein
MVSGRKWIAFVLIAFAGVSCSERPPNHVASPRETEQAMNPRLREWSTLPDGIEVVHTPARVRARSERQPDGRVQYRWVYRTTVRAKGTPVTVQEFGSFDWHDGKWVFSNFTGKPFSGRDFADWYSCPDAKLSPDAEASDPSNWSGGIQHLQAGKMRWFFVGIDDAGRRVKGEAVVELLAELK